MGETKLSESAKRDCMLCECNLWAAQATCKYWTSLPVAKSRDNQFKIAEQKNTVEALKLELSQLKKALSDLQDQATQPTSIWLTHSDHMALAQLPRLVQEAIFSACHSDRQLSSKIQESTS